MAMDMPMMNPLVFIEEVAVTVYQRAKMANKLYVLSFEMVSYERSVDQRFTVKPGLWREQSISDEKFIKKEIQYITKNSGEPQNIRDPCNVK